MAIERAPDVVEAAYKLTQELLESDPERWALLEQTLKNNGLIDRRRDLAVVLEGCLFLLLTKGVAKKAGKLNETVDLIKQLREKVKNFPVLDMPINKVDVEKVFAEEGEAYRKACDQLVNSFLVEKIPKIGDAMMKSSDDDLGLYGQYQTQLLNDFSQNSMELARERYANDINLLLTGAALMIQKITPPTAEVVVDIMPAVTETPAISSTWLKWFWDSFIHLLGLDKPKTTAAHNLFSKPQDNENASKDQNHSGPRLKR